MSICVQMIYEGSASREPGEKVEESDRKIEEVKQHALFQAKAHNRSVSPFSQGNPAGEVELSPTRQLGGGEPSYSCIIGHC